MKEKDKTDKEIWVIQSETGETPEEMSLEDQMEFFRQGAEESIGTTARRRSRRRRQSQVIGRNLKPRKLPRSAPEDDDVTE
ncbi:MAG: hypothetical protein C4524_11580 [Candidatus Zixiibacteriota bacterium]|nr:MAG: hypothetical protein C4524_11580 [candidate division Zixibacteria bacterium]